MKKYDKIKTLGNKENEDIFKHYNDDIYIEEKIDGANFRFSIYEGMIVFGSRNTILENTSNNNWTKCVNFVKEKVNNSILSDLENLSNLVFFGECCIPHTLKYNLDIIPPFLGFDIWDNTNEKYLNPVFRNEIFEFLNLPVVPTIKKLKVYEINILDDMLVPMSLYRKGIDNELAEGIVIKNYKKQIFAKVVRSEFKEENKKIFRGSPKHAKNDTEKIYLKYSTTARIKKVALKLRDEENVEINRKMMHKLPNAIIYDIYEEHGKEIFMSNYIINFKELKKLISKRCLKVIDDILIEFIRSD